MKLIYASKVAKLDSNVYTGGGTDDTDALQAVLDSADESGLHLIIDGAALVRGLKVKSNTTVECPNNCCGLYLANDCNCAVLSNMNMTFDGKIQDKNIKIIGGTYNHNCLNQVHTTNPDEMGNIAPGWKMTIALEFYGVEYMTIKDIVIRDQRTYAMLTANFKYVTMENIILDLPNKMYSQNQDGLHFFGPGKYLNMRNIGGVTGDDIIALAPDERDCMSSITDVVIDGVYVDGADQAIRLLSRDKGRLDRVFIRNVYGTYTSYGFYIQPWYKEAGGNFGAISIENVNLVQTSAVYDYQVPFLFRVGGKIDNLVLSNIYHNYPTEKNRFIEIGYYSTTLYEGTEYEKSDCYDGFSYVKNFSLNNTYIIKNENSTKVDEYITVNCPIENFVVNNFNTVSSDERVLGIRSSGKIEKLKIN